MNESGFDPGAAAVDHYGFLVSDLEASRPRCEALLGVRFGEPVNRDEVRLCRSLDGPPFLELIESTADGNFSGEQGGGFHHLGLLDEGAGERWHEAPEMLISVVPR